MNNRIKIVESLGLDQKDNALEIIRADNTTSTPWFVQLLSGVGAWIAALLFVVTFYLFGGGNWLFQSQTGSITTGIILLIIVFSISIGSDRLRRSIFIDQLMLAASLAGQFLLFSGLSFKDDYSAVFSGTVAAILSLCFIFFYKNSIHKFISTGVFILSVGVVLEELGFDPFAFSSFGFVMIAAMSAWMWLNESRFLVGKLQAIARPVQYALILSFLIGGGIVERFYSDFFSYQFDVGNNLPEGMISILTYLQFVSAGLFLVLAYVIITILRRLEIDWKSLAGIGLLAFALVIAIIFNHSPSILAALIVLLIGIERGNRILVPLAIFALITFYSEYYYSMDMTLMKKSLILMGSGLVMLAGGWIASRAKQAGERS